MKKRWILPVFLFLGIPGFAQDAASRGAQVAGSDPSRNYDRISLTLLMLDFQGESYMGELETAFRSATVPGKFNDHLVPTRVLEAPYRHFSGNSQSADLFGGGDSPRHAAEIMNLAVRSRVTNEMVAKWFGKKPGGAFSDAVLRERGLYNAKDGDVMVAGASSAAGRLSDQGERMIGRTFLLVMDYDWVRSVPDIRSGSDDKSRMMAASYADKNGFVATGRAYLYQLAWNDSVQAVLYSDYWCSEKDDPAVIAARDKAFGEAPFAIRYLMSVAVSGDGTQPNPETFTGKLTRQKSRDELFRQLVDNSIASAIDKAERKLEEFRVKVPIAEKHPIRVKIGAKEGLRVDQRYFVYEAVQTDAGIKMKRRGVIRATSKIADNRQVATGHTSDEMMSKFYQVAGRRLDPGMRIQQRNDAGLGISLGGFAQTTDFSNFMISAGIDYNVSPLLSHLIRRIPHSIKIGVDYSYGVPVYPIDYTESLPGFDPGVHSPAPSATFGLVTTRLGFTLSKDFHFFRVMRFTPYVGYSMETAKFSEGLVYYYGPDPLSGQVQVNTIQKDTTYAKINFFTAGAKLGINITHFMQLMFTVHFLGPDYKGYDLDPGYPPIRKNWMETGACLHFEF